MLSLMKIKTSFLVALILLPLLSLSLISSASASVSSNNRENVKSPNLINDGISASALSDENNDSVAITASDYCKFLNAVAASDPHHLYENRLEAIG